MKKRKPQWYHWTALVYCAVNTFIMGVLNVTGGADASSRFYVIDDPVVRLLGVGLILFSIGLFLRRHWVFIGALSLLALSILEVIVTINIEMFDAPRSLAWGVTLACIFIFFGIPIGLLAWLRTVFIGRKTEPENPPYLGTAAPSGSSDPIR